MKAQFTKDSQKELSKLGIGAQRLIKKYIIELQILDDPRSRGKALSGNLKGLWRYRVENYRLICEIQDDVLTILILKVGHRSTVYK